MNTATIKSICDRTVPSGSILVLTHATTLVRDILVIVVGWIVSALSPQQQPVPSSTRKIRQESLCVTRTRHAIEPMDELQQDQGPSSTKS